MKVMRALPPPPSSPPAPDDTTQTAYISRAAGWGDGTGGAMLTAALDIAVSAGFRTVSRVHLRVNPAFKPLRPTRPLDVMGYGWQTRQETARPGNDELPLVARLARSPAR